MVLPMPATITVSPDFDAERIVFLTRFIASSTASLTCCVIAEIASLFDIFTTMAIMGI